VTIRRRVSTWLCALAGLASPLTAAEVARPELTDREPTQTAQTQNSRPGGVRMTSGPGTRGAQPIQDSLSSWEEVLRSEDGSEPVVIETQPVQYPFENDPFEGRGPDGLAYPPEGMATPDWRDQSVLQPEQCLPQPRTAAVEWSSSRFTFDIIPRTEDGIGFTNAEYRGTIKFPNAPFLWISPRFAWHFLNGPKDAPDDVPKQVYDGSVDTTLGWRSQDGIWMSQLTVAPGVFSDFENTSDGFRLTARAFALYQWKPDTQFLFGASYLGRKDLPWFPILGVIYVPNDWLRYEISLPRPRVAYRYYADGDRERWAYVAGELGGGTWAVRRPAGGGTDDLMTYRDLQFVGGIEHKDKTGLGWQCEVGCVFARRLEWESQIGDRDLGATGIMRVMLTF